MESSWLRGLSFLSPPYFWVTISQYTLKCGSLVIGSEGLLSGLAEVIVGEPSWVDAPDLDREPPPVSDPWARCPW